MGIGSQTLRAAGGLSAGQRRVGRRCLATPAVRGALRRDRRRAPEDVAGVQVGVPGQDEQQVRQPVEVGGRQACSSTVAVLGHRRPGRPLRPTDDWCAPHAAALPRRVPRAARTSAASAGPRCNRSMSASSRSTYCGLDPQRRDAAARPRPGCRGRRRRRTARSAPAAGPERTSSATSAVASATPRALFASSTSAKATRRGVVLAGRGTCRPVTSSRRRRSWCRCG